MILTQLQFANWQKPWDWTPITYSSNFKLILRAIINIWKHFKNPHCLSAQAGTAINYQLLLSSNCSSHLQSTVQTFINLLNELTFTSVKMKTCHPQEAWRRYANCKNCKHGKIILIEVTEAFSICKSEPEKLMSSTARAQAGPSVSTGLLKGFQPLGTE